MKKGEILAPSGSKEAAVAAIEAGCDAIYLAGKMFGARAYASNFSDLELKEIITYAHLYNVKVYVTCNILIYEREIKTFMDYVSFLHENNVDALIMQDLGMIDLVHKTFPNLELHASTQMHIHNLEGAQMASKLGIKRVVLARETPLDVIKEIKEKTDLEIEVFVQGALCASYSGMCLFAKSIGPRSGNRGTCSGCCRLPYDLETKDGIILNKDKYPLSMRDLMTLDKLDKLIEIGIDSFKIEGRMKSPSYVYTTVKLYKETRDYYLKKKKIKINEKDLYNLKNIFNRTYTNGYMFNCKDVINAKYPNHQGIVVGKVIKSKNNFITIKLSDEVSLHDGLRIIKDDFTYGLILNEFKKDNKTVHLAKKNEVITLKVNKNIPLGSTVLRTSSYLIEKEIIEKIQSHSLKIPLKMICNIKNNKPVELIINDYQNEVKVQGMCPLVATKKAITKEDIKEKLLKIQNTIYTPLEVEINLDKNLFLPISTINNLKREAIELLNQKRLARFQKEYKKEEYKITLPDYPKVEEYTLLTNKKEDITKKYKYYYSFLDIGGIKKLPKVMENYQNLDIKKEYLVGELGSLNKLKNVVTDFSFNVTNSFRT